MTDEKEWKPLSSQESHGGLGRYGVRVNALVDREFTEDEKSLAYKFSDELMKLMQKNSVLADPEAVAAGKRVRDELILLFDGTKIHVQEIPNEYCSQACCLHSPWLIVTSFAGRIKVGWRKRVIVIDWSDSDVAATAAYLFPNEDVTKEGRMIHAWGYEKAREYIEKLLLAKGARA